MAKKKKRGRPPGTGGKKRGPKPKMKAKVARTTRKMKSTFDSMLVVRAALAIESIAESLLAMRGIKPVQPTDTASTGEAATIRATDLNGAEPHPPEGKIAAETGDAFAS